MKDVIQEFARGAAVSLQPLSGGLESTVALARTRGAAGALPRRFIVKRLSGREQREARIYEQLAAGLTGAPVAAVLGVARDAQAQYLFLEEVRAANPWPWPDISSGALVMRELARLHANTRGRPLSTDWDYDADLEASAAGTLRLAAALRDASGARVWRRTGDLRRVVQALPAIRAHLRDAESCWIHGDVHPGNVIVASGATGPRLVFIDWARARVGSPLEDVACWLQSVGCWVPEARRRHDTLLREYLAARGWGRTASGSVRRAYWLAAACNVLSGALRYHLAAVCDPASSAEARVRGRQALGAAERVIRRAAACVREPLVTTAG